MSGSAVHEGPVAVAAVAEVELAIGGMTCASCAARIEKKLNRMAGVSATVNYATEKAKVSYAGDVRVADLIATVVQTGYTAEEPPPPAPEPGAAAADSAAGQAPAALRRRLVVSAA
ncbi:cation transporter, partial [Streptomyces sp. NPDC054838]